MAGLIKNLIEVHQKAEENSRLSQQNVKWIPTLRLMDGEFAEVRFLTELPDAYQIRQHRVKVQTPKGQSWRRKYCTLDDTGQCGWCAQGNTPSKVMFFWGWVEAIYHRSQNKQLDNDPSAQKWAEVKVAGNKYFKQEVSGPWIINLPPGMKGALRGQIIEYSNEYGGLGDRIYKISRSGEGLKTTYQVTPKDPSPMPEEAEERAKTLPDLGDIAFGKIYAFDQKPKSDTDTPAF